MKKAVLIVEDEPNQQMLLTQIVESISKEIVLYTADNAAEAYAILMDHTIDVFLVDIVLDNSARIDASGIQLVEKFRKIPKYMFTPVIFVTSLEDPTLYAYTGLNCLGYIEKPYEIPQVKCLLERALNFTTIRDKDGSLSFRKEGVWYLVKVKNIIYMEVIKHAMFIHTSNGSVLDIPYLTCKQVLKDDDTGCLVQCNRSTIINRDFVQCVDGPNQYITLQGKAERVTIGRTFKKKIMAEF